MATVAKNATLASRSRFSPEMGWKTFLVHHAWVLPVLGLALWLRAVNLHTRFLYGDEAEYAIVARYLSRDWLYLAYPAIEGGGAAPFVSQPPLLLYVSSIFMRIMGPTDLVAMLPSVVFGTATVLVVYAMGLRLGGRFVGLAAATFVAVLPFHVEMSRKAMLDAGYVFFVALTAYFLIRWLETRSRRHAVAVGLATVAACLSKLPGVLVAPVVLGVFVGAVVVALVKRAMVKETLIQGGLGAAPVAIGGLAYFGLLSSLDAVSNLWMKLQWQLGRVDAARATIVDQAQVRRPWDWYFTDPAFSVYALFGKLVMLLALIGMVWAIVTAFRTRRMGYVVVPAMVLSLGAFFLYSQRKEGFYLLPFVPFLAILAALAADAVRQGILRAMGDRPRAALVATGVAIALLAMPTVGALGASYNAYQNLQTNEKYFGSGAKEAALFIHQTDPNAGQYGALLTRFTLYWYNEQPTSHMYVDSSFLNDQVKKGKVKYVVYDEYILLATDRDLMRNLINANHGQLVFESKQGWGDVKVFELHPSA